MTIKTKEVPVFTHQKFLGFTYGHTLNREIQIDKQAIAICIELENKGRLPDARQLQDAMVTYHEDLGLIFRYRDYYGVVDQPDLNSI